jgi:hypothetical protein
MGSIGIIWAIGAVIAGGCFARALAMRSGADHYGELKWYTIGSCVCVVVCFLWASLEPNAVPQQRAVIGIVGAIAGAFILVLVTEFVRPHSVPSATLPPTIVQAQVKVLDDFQVFLGDKNESELQDIFDIGNILHLNTLIYRQDLDETMPKKMSELAWEYFKDGIVLFDTTKNINVTHRPSGSADLHVMPGRVAALAVSKKNVDARSRLAGFYTSAELPVGIKDSIKEIDGLVEKDLTNMIEVLDSFMISNKQAIVHDSDSSSPLFASVNNKYFSTIEPIRPKIDDVLKRLHSYFGID